MAIFLIDYDGTCIPRLPKDTITKFDTGAEKVLKLLLARGHKLVLWTVRNKSSNNPFNYDNSGVYKEVDSLEEAVNWFNERNIPLFGINKVPNEVDIVGDSRKALGDFLIDDISLGIPLRYEKIKYYDKFNPEFKNEIYTCFVDWEKILIILKDLNLL